MVSEADFYELLRYCPLNCPFLRKKKDAYTFLCFYYKSFLDVKKGRVMRHRLCGEGVALSDYTSFKNLLKKLGKDAPLTFTRDENNLLENLFVVLDASEQVIMETVLQTASLTDNFLKKVEKAVNGDGENLLANMRAMLKAYEEDELADDPALQWKLKAIEQKKGKKLTQNDRITQETQLEEIQQQTQEKHKNHPKQKETKQVPPPVVPQKEDKIKKPALHREHKQHENQLPEEKQHIRIMMNERGGR